MQNRTLGGVYLDLHFGKHYCMWPCSSAQNIWEYLDWLKHRNFHINISFPEFIFAKAVSVAYSCLLFNT